MAKASMKDTIVTAEPVKIEEPRSARPMPTVKSIHLHAGLDLIASKTSVNAKETDMYETSAGVLCVSKKTKRKVVIPYANIRGFELL